MDVSVFIDMVDTPLFLNRTHKKAIIRRPIFIWDSDHDYILDEIMHRDKIAYDRQFDIEYKSDNNHK